MSVCAPTRTLGMLCVLLASWILPSPSIVCAQATAVTVGSVPSTDQIQAKLAAIESALELDESDRVRLAELYRQTLAELENKRTLETSLAKLRQEIEDVPLRFDETQREIAELVKSNTAMDALTVEVIKRLDEESIEQDMMWLELATKTLEQIESRRNEQRALLDEARKSLAFLQGEPKRRADRRIEIPNLISSLQHRIKALETEAGANAQSDDHSQALEARRNLLQARISNAELEIEAAKYELELYDAAVALLPIRFDLAQRKAIQLEQIVKLYGAASDRLRERINRSQSKTAATEASNRPTELNLLTKTNIELTSQRQEVGASIQETRQKLEASVKLGNRLREQFDRIQLQIGPATQVTEAVGQILRKTRQDLPKVRKLRESSASRKTKLYDVRFALIDCEQQLWPLSDMEAKIASELRSLAVEVPWDRLQELEPDLRELLQSQKSALEGLRADLETYYSELAILDLQEEQVIVLSENYAAYIDQRVLWIRSVPPINIADIADAGKSIRWLLNTTSWTTVLRSLWESGIRRYPLVNVLLFITLLGLAGTRRMTKRRIAELGELAESHLCCDIRLTVRALIQTVAGAALWPILFAWLSWNLYQVANGSELVRPLAIAFGAIALMVFSFELWRFALKPSALAQSHFLWPQRRLRLLRNNLRWFMPLWIPSIFLFHVFHATENLIYEKSLARILFVFASILLAVFVQRLASPKTGFMKEYLLLNRGGWLDQLSWLWYPLMVGIPIVIGILAILGYQYTAAHLLRRFSFSIVFLSVVYVGSACGLRWIMLRRRAISIAHTRERGATQAMSDRKQAADSVGGVTLAESPDLSIVNAQSIRMLRSLGLVASLFGLYLIWSSIMPALAQLDDVPLFPTALTSPGSTGVVETPAAARSMVQPPVPAVSPIVDYFSISLGQLIGAIAITIVTAIAVLNIPGFMEIVLLQRLPLDASLRFAITTISRYVLVAAGLVWALGSLGIGWGKIQWLVAALSVGLGFGLQEIFANFVSGLILLFERPLRAGDIVTIGDTSGKVVRINTRATTIRDWDRKELIVPNKEFVTGKLLNWTLNDTTHRIVICVGIAYGSDVKNAHDVVLAVAQRHSGVLDDPQPSVVFDAFGESSLNLTLRCFLPNLDGLFPVTHALHEAIHDELRAAGIEIAFPQRDIHVRSIDAKLRLNDRETDRLLTDASLEKATSHSTSDDP